MKLLALVAAALVLPQSGDSAEAAALFRKFEKELKESKALEISFSSKVEEKGKSGDTLRGKIRLAKENKAHIEAEGTLDGKDFSVKIISDGNVLKMISTERDNLGEIATPGGFNQDVIARFARTSAVQMVKDVHRLILGLHDRAGGARSPGTGMADLPPTPGHFKMGAPESLGKITWLQIRFVISEATAGDRSQVALWLEKEKLSPYKRTLEPLQERGAKVSEQYSSVELAAEFARDAFKLNRR